MAALGMSADDCSEAIPTAAGVYWAVDRQGRARVYLVLENGDVLDFARRMTSDEVDALEDWSKIPPPEVKKTV